MTKLSPTTKKRLQDVGVGIVYLFGSRASGVSHEKSDYDVGVVFTDYRKLVENTLELPATFLKTIFWI